jgi:hypothetical protein
MEEWGVPAFFLAKNGQLAAYVVVCLMLERFADNLQILTKQGNSSCR